jgi:3-phenylpropionate/cinnamic acid dioxygenase small subunit
MDEDSLQVKSNVLLHRSQGDTAESDVVTAEREDRLDICEDHLKLADRTVRLAHTTLPFDRMTILSYL